MNEIFCSKLIADEDLYYFALTLKSIPVSDLKASKALLFAVKGLNFCI
jgi:hypothetical protein